MSGYYLDIPRDYCKPLGGLRWAALAEAIESDDGRTFALTPQLLAFLEGFASQRPLIHFGHILHFFHLLRLRKTAHHDFTPLAMAWLEAGRPARTAGVVCALLCPEVPVALNPPRLDELAGWLNVWARVSVRPVMPGDEPEMDGDLFESLLSVELASYSFQDLVHWFRHGQGAVAEEGQALARDLLAEKPRSLAEVLAQIGRHDRLSGAVPFVSSLLGALSLPPRRQESPEMPVGGFADVTTKGRPEAILAAQFALDEWEFLRRFAQNELLYYRREDPAVRTREDLVILLDQGVRTWGGVRILLAAAVFALGQMARRSELSLRLALTSSGGSSFDPVTLDPAALADQLGQSDLSATPAAALATLVSEAAPGPRDIILLTHPLNREEPQTLAACAGLGPASRLFALTADAGGAIELSELRRAGIVPISRCRVNLDVVTPKPQRDPATAAGWTGDVEPIGYPFLFGLSGHHEPLRFGFDHAGQWLLVVSHPGTLLALRTDGSAHEILPRPLFRDRLLDSFTSVIGVEGGFVLTTVYTSNQLLGMDSDQVVSRTESIPVAAFYHLPSRSCQVIAFSLAPGQHLRWRYLHRPNALAVMRGDEGQWIRLLTGRDPEPLPRNLHWPAPAESIRTRLVLPGQEIELAEAPFSAWAEPILHLAPASSDIILTGALPAWQPFTPWEEGRLLLDNLVPVAGECRLHTLAVRFRTPGYNKQLLWLFEWPVGSPIARLEMPISHNQFTLSADGSLLAVQRGHGQLQIRDVAPDMGIRCVTPVGRFHNNLVVDLGEMWLRLIIGQTTHEIRWFEGVLMGTVDRTAMPVDVCEDHEGVRFTRARADGPKLSLLGNDSTRFRASARYQLITAVVTSFGEVFLFDEKETLVAGFFVFRQELAGWMPDGTRWGSELLLGQPATAEAYLHMGAALLAASALARRKAP